MPVRLALHDVFANNDIRAVAQLAWRLNLQGVTIGFSPELADLSGTAARDVRHVFSSAAVQLVALDHPRGVRGFSPQADIDREIASLDKTLNAAAALGHPIVCYEVATLPPPPNSRPSPPPITPTQAGAILIPQFSLDKPSMPLPPAPRDPAFEDSLQGALREVARRADRLGVTIAFSATLADFASLEHWLKQTDCPWFGVDVETTNVLADNEGIDAVFSRIGSLIRHVRLCDGVRNSRGQVMPKAFGDGQFDFAHFFANLAAADYRGFATLNPPVIGANLPAALEFLRKTQS